MKLLKKLTALFLAVVMVMALGITAFAEGTENDEETVYTVDITITGAAAGATYHAYRLLETSVSLNCAGSHQTEADHSSTCYSLGYDKNTDYWNIVSAVVGERLGNESVYVKDVYDYLLTLKTAEGIYGFAKEIYPEVVKKTADATANTAENGTATLEDIPSGYWLIVEKKGEGFADVPSLLLLDTVGMRNITIHAKRDDLHLEKKVQDNGTNYGMFADHQIGEDVNFWLYTPVPDHAEAYSTYTYRIHDSMEKGLTFNPNSVEIRINSAVEEKFLSKDYYTVIENPKDEVCHTDNCTRRCTFHIEINMKKALADGALLTSDNLYVLYKAKLNNEASVIYQGVTSEENYHTNINNANENTAWLEYNHNPFSNETKHTNESKAYVWTFRVKVQKVDNTQTQLEGAKFALSLNGNLTETQLNDPANFVPLVKHGNEAGHFHVYDGESEVAEGSLVTEFDAGSAILGGFDDQTNYYLYELKAPVGYNKLKAPTLFKFNVVYAADASTEHHFADGYPMITVDNLPPSGMLEAKVVNQTGTELPSTGGIGTTIFYVLGGIMVVGAAVLLITKKRMGAEV